MMVAKVMDVISRLPGCAGQAADAVFLHTQVKMEDSTSSWMIPKSECPDTWTRQPKHKLSKSLSSMEDPIVHFERNLYGHLLAGLYGSGNARNFDWDTEEKSSKLRMLVRYWESVSRTPTQTACTSTHVSQHTLNRLTTLHHTNTRDSRAGRLRIAQFRAPKNKSSTCHVSLLAALDAQVLF